MARNPFEDSARKAESVRDSYAFDLGVVRRVEDDDSHMAVVEVVSSGSEAPERLPVMVTAQGDISLPSRGDMVVIGYARGRKPFVLGTIYTRQTAPTDYESGERVLSGSAGVFLEGPFGVVPIVSEAPDAPPDGSVWYRDDLDEYRGMEGGTKVRFDTTAV